ncbi:site-specific DNA-methyltransferase [Schaalia sp. Marseille-Q2122]|uniref:site-specific DNA-methyltransferase n=1 Tax=Schaalia sp. Marseille-Q2122 TaxID=2736604 RepID=UPI00158AC8B9|nr:site-specific DNA-methyltransferase [Schaalia sp. Marseille-Q2122]
MTLSVPDETRDTHEELLTQLRDLVPIAFLDGELDRDALLGALGLDDSPKPSFSFSWPGIELARQDARVPTTATLVPDEDASLYWSDARDVLIEGDNLQVLKLLKNGYSRAVKLIYIDPPYNRGDTFTYNDDFAVPERQYLEETGQVDDQGNATTSRIETGGRKHAPWLTMMFPRLTLARHLLRRDGVILVSIDNNEVHHLRLLLDAVFGAENFVDMMTWRGSRKGDAKLTGGGQDYILVYARDRSYLKANDVRWRQRKDGLEPIYAKVAELRAEFGDDYEAMTAGLRSWYKSLADEDPSKAHSQYSRVDANGVWFSDNISSPNYRENLIYDWKGYSPPANGWRYERETMERLDAEGRLIYPEDRSRRIQIKWYLHMREEWAPASVFYRDRRGASATLESLMGAKVFDDPKSTDVLARLFHAITDDGDLILDFFAGSGSTGQAVWEQNPKDGKTRHWILVQVPEKPDTSEESGRNALAAGYETIFEITAERIRRASTFLQKETLDAPQLGFRIFRARPTNLIIEKPIIASAELTGQDYLMQVLDYTISAPVVDGAKPLDVAWEVALKATDTKLDARVTTHELDDVTVFEFAPADGESVSGRLLISLEAFSLATAEALGLSDDDTLILRGDQVEDSVTLTLAPRLKSKLILLERVPREVSL